MAEERRERRAEFSAVTFLGAVGGLCLVAAFLTPIFEVDPAKATNDDAAAMLRDYQGKIDELRRELEAARSRAATVPIELQAAAHVMGPAADHVVDFIASPSLYRLTVVARDAHRLLPVVAALQPAEAETLKKVRAGVAAFTAFMVVIPIVGLYPVVRGILRGFRKQSTPGLVVTFFTGLCYLTLGAIIVIGVPDDARDHLGPSLWFLTLGGALAVLNGIFGVSRSTWWKAYLIYAAGFAAVVYLAATLAATLE